MPHIYNILLCNRWVTRYITSSLNDELFKHNILVIKNLFKLKEWDGLAIEQKNILLYSAIFHDIGKLVSKKNHPKTGEVLTMEILTTQNMFSHIDPETKYKISKYVRFHGRPAILRSRCDTREEFIEKIKETKRVVSYINLCLLSEADVMVKKEEEKHILMNEIFLFKDFCEKC